MVHSGRRLKFGFQGDFIGGQFKISSEVSGEWVGKSPADLSDELGRFQYSHASIEYAVGAAKGALKSWRRLRRSERGELLSKYQEALRRREAQFCEAMAREVGKPLWEARAELAAMIERVDITLNEGVRRVVDLDVPRILDNAHGACRYRPHGVMAVMGPFSSPGDLPGGHIVPALLMGNTVIFKPSEKAPLVGQLMAECFNEAGFPAGVFNLIQGERETGRRLVTHEGVDGVLFTGSYEVGTRIKQDTLLQHWKLLVLEMGGKNTAIVWGDANLDIAVQETLIGAFISAGQSCGSTSQIIVQRTIAESFLSRFHERAKGFTIAHPLENPFMGPLIDHGAVDRYMKFLGIASREGGELVMRGKTLDVGLQGHYVVPSICWMPSTSVEAARKSVFQQTELFAPSVAVIAVDDLEESVALANAAQYGLAASVFCRDRAIYDQAREGLQVGLVNWNKATVAVSARLPFGGRKKSGNHFPTGIAATAYCAYPVASIEDPEPRLCGPDQYPGLNWK